MSLLNILISKLQEKNLINYLNFQLLEHTFFFHVNYYDQIDRVAMGSPLGPVLADLVMCFYEKRWLDQFQFCDVSLSRRHVNDIICLFDSGQDVDEF